MKRVAFLLCVSLTLTFEMVAQFGPKTYLERPARFQKPVENVDLKTNDTRVDKLRWTVWSDRDGNETREFAGTGRVVTTLGFLEEYIVAEEKDEYIHIFKDPLPRVLEMGNDAKDCGWVEKSKMLLWPHCLVMSKGKIAKKVFLTTEYTERHGNRSVSFRVFRG